MGKDGMAEKAKVKKAKKKAQGKKRGYEIVFWRSIIVWQAEQRICAPDLAICHENSLEFNTHPFPS